MILSMTPEPLPHTGWLAERCTDGCIHCYPACASVLAYNQYFACLLIFLARLRFRKWSPEVKFYQLPWAEILPLSTTDNRSGLKPSRLQDPRIGSSPSQPLWKRASRFVKSKLACIALCNGCINPPSTSMLDAPVSVTRDNADKQLPHFFSDPPG